VLEVGLGVWRVLEWAAHMQSGHLEAAYRLRGCIQARLAPGLVEQAVTPRGLVVATKWPLLDTQCQWLA
jgi:hypothetical protein